MKAFVKSLDRELTVLQQEEALLEKELSHVRRRQDKVRKLRGLYTGVNILADELEPVEGASIALSEAEMIERVKENAGRELTAEEIQEHVYQDFGIRLSPPPHHCVRRPAGKEMRS